MKNVVRFKPSANLTLMGMLYALASAVQVWYWVENFYFKHPAYLPGMLRFAISGPTTGAHLIGFVGLAYHAMFAWIILYLFYIGCKLIWLSRDAGVRIVQTSEQRRETIKALCFLLVVFLVSFVFAPNMHAATTFDPETRLDIELFLVELMAVMMACYSLMAIQKYKGG